MGGLPLHALPSASAARARFGLVLAATLFAALALPAFASATKFPLVLEKTGFGEGAVTSSPIGINCPAECSTAEHEYAEGTKIVLTASPKAGSIFSGWFGCDTEPSATKCEVTVNEETYVEAEFNEVESFFLVLEKSGTGEGTVTSSPAGISCGPTCFTDEAEYLEGTKVVLTATASPGSVFEGWTGCDAQPSATKCEVTIHEETYVEAEFTEIAKFPLVLEKGGTGTGTVTSSPSGINCATVCPEAEAEYLEGTKVVLTASASAGSVFSGWTGCDAQPSATKCEVTIHEEAYVKAAFSLSSKPKYSLTVTTAGTGTGTVNCNGGVCAASYEQGTKVSLTASAAVGSTFAGFSGGGCSDVASCVVTINGNTTVTATFSANPQPTCATNASLCPPPPPGQAKAASSARVKNGKAALKITCSGGACKGGFNLTAKIKRGGKTKTVQIGKASFSLADGASTMLKVKLSAAARQELDKGRSIKAKLSGTSIAGSAVKLTPGQK
ncbi:MAG TPA: hypothetical protein VFJ64_00040 [Solirubrobacterales bacterium]|nr:hypothetical protein [Solirubrobacterales bacterium]